MPTPSLERMCWRPPRPKPGGLSCEIARIFTRIVPHITGTFNLVVKDRIALRLSGAYSVRTGTLTRIRPSSKPFKVTASARRVSTRLNHRFSTAYAHRFQQLAAFSARKRLHLPLGSSARLFFSARADAEDSQLRKDLLEVLAIYA